ncbi:2-dehydropantoate 2-reductase family protein [Ralstonia insidiosa]|uniref:2-dehydropantoate 2-reductase n=1 Tax=Ralstonia insidiosa TaxID=190721 RepID=A0AAC9FRS4_9RALS|nr:MULTISPECIES: 2-dehydropantoate 2-reductase [Ralstonia]ANH74019.1 2-dehydropantoate 2-reductase family protein [Ralstonia insidiosa]EPX97516.1 2-dehydropantoate 2-reductase [Ralstonia sp. AU12-08]MBY4703571.1 2-dehydropantoate 2-reductase [Ralstonia insidiosa]
MKIAILGAGAMGSLFGGLLAETGEQVTLLDINDAHLSAITAHGLRLETDTGDRHVRNLQALRPSQITQVPDLLIVFTKSMHTRAALASVRQLIGPSTYVLTLQNGLGNVEALASAVPQERILVGVTTWPADLAGPGHVRSHGAGVIRMMTADGVDRPMLERVVSVLSGAGLRCQADANVWGAVWEKVAFNAALNPLCTVLNRPVDALGAVEDGPALALTIVEEVLAVARASGISVDAIKVSDNVRHAIVAHRGHKPSMLQDVLAGRPTEIESINGAVVVAAQRHGVRVPHTETLMQLVRLVQAQSAHPQTP